MIGILWSLIKVAFLVWVIVEVLETDDNSPYNGI